MDETFRDIRTHAGIYATARLDCLQDSKTRFLFFIVAISSTNYFVIIYTHTHTR